MSVADKYTTLTSEKIPSVHDAGKQAQHTWFWDQFQDFGNRDHYFYAFSYYNFDDTTYDPQHTIKTGTTNTGGQNLFYSSYGITDTKVDIIFEKTANGAFNNARKMKTIRKMIVNENVTFANTFTNAEALETISFEGTIGQNISFADSDKLNDLSIDNIVEHLKDLTGATSKSLTVHATVYDKMVADGKDALVTAKNWALVKA